VLRTTSTRGGTACGRENRRRRREPSRCVAGRVRWRARVPTPIDANRHRAGERTNPGGKRHRRRAATPRTYGRAYAPNTRTHIRIYSYKCVRAYAPFVRTRVRAFFAYARTPSIGARAHAPDLRMPVRPISTHARTPRICVRAYVRIRVRAYVPDLRTRVRPYVCFTRTRAYVRFTCVRARLRERGGTPMSILPTSRTLRLT
jgi:hypothetical protein